MTEQRTQLFKFLQNHPALTINEVISSLPRQDQATVYRNIKLFEGLGIITRLQLGWHSKLELSDVFQHHHHHFTCLSCGKVMALNEDKTLEQHIKRLNIKLGFMAMDHQLEIRGYCHRCQKIKPSLVLKK